MIAERLSRKKDRAVDAGKRFNIDFRQQAMPEPKKIKKTPVKSTPACETVFRLNATVNLPIVPVAVTKTQT